jgi:hypothetical protein
MLLYAFASLLVALLFAGCIVAGWFGPGGEGVDHF